MRALKTEIQKIIPTNHHEEFYRDIGIDCSVEKHGGGADQSFKNSCDINIIMEQYAKTGLLPQTTQIPPSFIDCTQVPSLETAFDIVNSAVNAFYELPPIIRKAMDNDPSKLENFIADAKNRDLLIQHGVLITQEPPKPTEEVK